ncbi:MAG: HEPN domain-containing protein [Chloroflexi bacterium]|nr:HEPN domain-containing protein [Chloroflexota bacterium]
MGHYGRDGSGRGADFAERGLLAPSVFHRQQGVEKLLKAIWVESIGQTPPRTHNLVDLATELALSIPEWLPFLRDLSNQAVASRYAGEQTYPREVAEEYNHKTVELCAQLQHHLS